MKLMRATEFRREYFTEKSRPARSTIYRWIRKGKLPGVCQDGTYYVDLDEFEAQVKEQKTGADTTRKNNSKETLHILAKLKKIRGE